MEIEDKDINVKKIDGKLVILIKFVKCAYYDKWCVPFEITGRENGCLVN